MYINCSCHRGTPGSGRPGFESRSDHLPNGIPLSLTLSPVNLLSLLNKGKKSKWKKKKKKEMEMEKKTIAVTQMQHLNAV